MLGPTVHNPKDMTICVRWAMAKRLVQDKSVRAG